MPATANASIVLHNSILFPCFQCMSLGSFLGHTFWKMLLCLALAGSTINVVLQNLRSHGLLYRYLKQQGIQNGCMMDKTASFIQVT